MSDEDFTTLAYAALHRAERKPLPKEWIPPLVDDLDVRLALMIAEAQLGD